MNTRIASRRNRIRRLALAHRRLQLEGLEQRLSPALLIAAATAEAFSDYQGTQAGLISNTDPNHTIAETTVGPVVTFLPTPFQESAYAESTTPGPVLGRSHSGGAIPVPNPNSTQTCSITTSPAGLTILPRQPSNSNATVSCSMSTATNNWVVSGVPAGTMVDVDVNIQIEGYLENLSFGGTTITSSVAASLVLASDVAPDAGLFSAEATLTNVVLQRTGPWTFSQVTGSQSRYETNHNSTVTFTFAAGEPFSLQAALGTLATSDGPFEVFAYSDFSTSGFTYSLSTSATGATIDPLGAVELARSAEPCLKTEIRMGSLLLTRPAFPVDGFTLTQTPMDCAMPARSSCRAMPREHSDLTPLRPELTE